MNRLAVSARAAALVVLAAMLTAATIATADAQPANPPPAAAPAPPAANPTSRYPMAVPGFWDPRRRPERPDLSRISIIRFLTETDYPPFNYAGPDGAPAGFNVDLARLICEEIKVACTVQMRRFDTLVASLNSNNGDAVIASIAETPEMRRQVDFSDPYYRTPARFVSRRDVEIDEVRPEALEGKKIAVVAGTAHEAYLKTLFTEAELHPYPNADAARVALKKRRGRSSVRRRHLARVLAQRHQLRRLLRIPRRALYGKPLLRRGRRHRGQARQRPAAAGVQLGAVPAVGEGPLHRPVAALFPDQPVLNRVVDTSAAGLRKGVEIVGDRINIFTIIDEVAVELRNTLQERP